MKRGFVLHHNGPPAGCLGKPHARCVAFWAAVKAYHMQVHGWSDIAYSFGVCPHGTRLVGRGWDKNQFAGGTDVVGSNDGPDSAWYSVLAFIGGDDSTRDTEKPTDEMVRGVIDLIDEGRTSGRCERRVLPHSAFKPKPCPGPQFTAYAHAWDNQALPGAPAQPTIPEVPEEDDMFLYTSPGKPVFFCAGGVSVGLNELPDLKTFQDAKVPAFHLDDDTFNKFRARFPGA